ncbi:MAG: 16S rRNA (cytosine(1402)-N(4))-methyltransferase RsmH [Deltaproteobacteria bacterium]|nr:16S rRNA (cytosine(1402)-N(4))-methyltransferase RsmH [Deltaproteobacteria bacterium]
MARPHTDESESEPRGHLPVMPVESLRELAIRSGDVVVDCTAGGGGHLRLFAAATGPSGRVLALDRDERAFDDDAAGGFARSASNVTLLHRAFSGLRAALDEQQIPRADVVFADLGVSSFQLDERARGFSFRHDAPLDMRMDPTQGETAAELIARLDDDELANVIFQYGDEPRSRRIARTIKRALPTTTAALTSAVVSVLGPQAGRKIHPATKTFQALRIAVNGELRELELLLESLPSVLNEGGRAGFLTFHSLEDRPVKLAFKHEHFRQTTKKPLTASDAEQHDNPRSRSAKLRVALYSTAPVEKKASKYANKSDDDDDDGSDS